MNYLKKGEMFYFGHPRRICPRKILSHNLQYIFVDIYILLKMYFYLRIFVMYLFEFNIFLKGGIKFKVVKFFGSLNKLDYAYLWPQPLRSLFCTPASGLPSGRIRLRYSIVGHKRHRRSKVSDRHFLELVAQLELEGCLGNSRRICFRNVCNRVQQLCFKSFFISGLDLDRGGPGNRPGRRIISGASLIKAKY